MPTDDQSDSDQGKPGLQVDKPNPARVYDWFLGGGHAFPADEEFARRILQVLPTAGQVARLNRAWLQRAVEFAASVGIRQFLDLGSGLPTSGHVHEIAQRHLADPHVVYVDNEPVALAQGRLVLQELPHVAIISADLRDPAQVFEHPTTRRLLDFTEPVMVLMAAVLHFVPDDRNPTSIVAGYREALAPGSLIAVSHTTDDQQPEDTTRAVDLYDRTTNPLTQRNRTQLTQLMGDLDILDPGIVFLPEWRPTSPDDVGAYPERSTVLALVARKRLNEQAPPGVDATVPHSARIWNYLLGGKDNYAVDRELADQFCRIMPQSDQVARVSRAFLQRAVRHLVTEAGIRQFLDVGTGLPTADNTHEVAQAAAPECRIVYVDNDPLVLSHARALLTSTPEGFTHFLAADLREPQTITSEAAAFLDFTQPIGLVLGGVLGHLTDQRQAISVLGHFLDAVPSGSYVVWYDGLFTRQTSPETREAMERYNDSGTLPYLNRTLEQVNELLTGLELLPPGIVMCPDWKPTAETKQDENGLQYCAVARKP